MARSLLIILLIGSLIGFALPAAPVYASVGIDPIAFGEQQEVLDGEPLTAGLDAEAWYDGIIAYSEIINCASIIQGMPYSEKGIGTYVGFAADPDAAKPAPNQVYYLHIVAYGLGNACSGQRIWVDFKLPANTSLAVSNMNPVICLASTGQEGNCPQNLPNSPFNAGAYSIPSSDSANAYTWPLPQGKLWEFRIPVISNTILTNSTFQAYIQALDGNDFPWLTPTAGIYVFSGTPNVLYPSPSTQILTSPSLTYKSNSYLYTYGLGGTIYFDLGSTSENYSLFTDSGSVPSGGNAFLAWTDWTPHVLQPNTTYHWRARFAASNGQTFYGVNQTFTTLPNGQVTVGNGGGASCTGSALDAALNTAGIKEVVFNCGSVPVNIQMSSMRTVSTTLTIDGGNKITLLAPAGSRHIEIGGAGNLTLKNVVLSGGSTGSCGGSVKINSGGKLTTNRVQFIGNSTTNNGGALCLDVNAIATLDYALFKNNAAGGSGGAIYNQGIAELRWSDVSNNSAQVNGGGFWNNNYLDINLSLVADNTVAQGATARGTHEGGGIYNGGGTTSVTASTIAGNRAYYAAGIFNNNADVWLTNVTMAGNTAAGLIGGVESKGSGISKVRNTLISGNFPDNCGTGYVKTIQSDGNNLDSGATCGFFGTGDLSNSNSQLKNLGFNGGITRTMALNQTSPAIDRANNSYCGFYDQRGFSGPPQGEIVSRNVDGDKNGSILCDIGAFEFNPAIDTGSQVFLPLIRR